MTSQFINEKIVIYEFSDHARQFQHLIYFLEEYVQLNNLECYLHKSNKKFISKTKIRNYSFLNSYLLLLKLSIHIYKKKKIIINSAPEFSNMMIKFLFTFIILISQSYNQVFLIIRDWKLSRGWFFGQVIFKKNNNFIFCENKSIYEYLLSKLYVRGYFYTSPFSKISNRKNNKNNVKNHTTVFLTGSLDDTRRDYSIYLDTLKELNKNKKKVITIIGGHTLSKTAKELLKKIKDLSFDTKSFNYMTDNIFDKLIINSDILLCLNRSGFYSKIKGTGAIGDAFFAGKKLVLYSEKLPNSNNENDILEYFSDKLELIKIFENANKNKNYLNIEKKIINEKEKYFKQSIIDFLKR